MSTFLAPVNYDRARELLYHLRDFTTYSPDTIESTISLLRQYYPTIFSTMDCKQFNQHAILLELQGSNSLEPLIFTAHFDSPTPSVSFSDSNRMTVPLSRAHFVALFESLDALLLEGYRPGGDLFICLSFDALSNGSGASSIADYLVFRNINPCFVLSTGGYITKDAFRTFLAPGSSLALIGISEKGVIEGGLVADGIVSLRNGRKVRPLHALLRRGSRFVSRPRKSSLTKSSEKLLQTLSKHAPYWRRILVSYPKITFPILRIKWRNRSVLKQFFQSERCIYAIKAEGEAQRVATKAWFGFRQTVLPNQSMEHAKESLKKLADHKELEISFTHTSEGGALSETTGDSYDALQTAIEIQFDNVVISPCLSPFMTDARYYSHLSNRLYRFSPFVLSGKEALLGECLITNETLQTSVQFFRSMLSV